MLDLCIYVTNRSSLQKKSSVDIDPGLWPISILMQLLLEFIQI